MHIMTHGHGLGSCVKGNPLVDFLNHDIHGTLHVPQHPVFSSSRALSASRDLQLSLLSKGVSHYRQLWRMFAELGSARCAMLGNLRELPANRDGRKQQTATPVSTLKYGDSISTRFGELTTSDCLISHV